MDSVEIKVLNYRFKFRRLNWRQEFAIKYLPKKDPTRMYLAHAIEEVSGIKPKDTAEALAVMNAIPATYVSKLWKLYKSSFPPAQHFVTAGLYKAPDTKVYMQRVIEESEGEAVEQAHDRAVSEMESKYNPADLKTDRDIDRKIFEAAQKRGALRKATPDE